MMSLYRRFYHNSREQCIFIPLVWVYDKQNRQSSYRREKKKVFFCSHHICEFVLVVYWGKFSVGTTVGGKFEYDTIITPCHWSVATDGEIGIFALHICVRISLYYEVSCRFTLTHGWQSDSCIRSQMPFNAVEHVVDLTVQFWLEIWQLPPPHKCI